MNDLDAVRLICVILQKRDSGKKNLENLTAQKANLEAKNPWYETRDCPVWADTALRDEHLLNYPACPFSKPYLYTDYFQNKLAAYKKRRRTGRFSKVLYEDQIRYTRYLRQVETIRQKNLEIMDRNKRRERIRIANNNNRKIREQRYRDACRKKENELAQYTSTINTFRKGVTAAEAMLESLYIQYHISTDKKVRTLDAMLHIYEYLRTGQCHPLTIGAATDKYFEREWQKAVLGKMDSISQTMHDIAASQSALQRSISEIKQGNLQISEQLRNLNAMSESMGGMLRDMNGTINNINTMKLGDIV